MNCRNVRREIEEAEPGELSSVSAKAHIASCLACETLFREQSNLQTIISSLGTVEAPGDFDFRLRARLAGESRGTIRSSGLGDFSFGFRSAVVAMLLLLIGSAFVFVSYRARVTNPSTAGTPQVASTAGAPAPVGDTTKGKSGPNANANVPQGAETLNQSQSGVVVAGLKPGDRVPLKRHGVKNELAAARGEGNRFGTRELSGTQAKVLRPNDQILDTYPTAAFPINASYQSLKVSLDDGRGSSRTISLPAVSFGSQRSLSQGGAPLMASARGVW